MASGDHVQDPGSDLRTVARVEVHRGARFDAAPGEVPGIPPGVHRWAEAAAAGATRAAARLAAAATPTRAAWLARHLRELGVAWTSAAVGHRRGDDGVDLVIHDVNADPALRADVLAHGGGIIVTQAQDRAPQLARLAGWAAVAWAAPVEVLVVCGAEPTRVLERRFARTWVLPVSEAVVVHPSDGPPSDLAVGCLAEVVGVPRLACGPEAVTVLVGEQPFDARARKAVLEDRARFHPLLRLDAPVAATGPVAVYGRPDPTPYLDLLAEEFAVLLDAADEAGLRRWWLHSHPSVPLPVPGGQGAWGDAADRDGAGGDGAGGDGATITVVGRVPGGFGVVDVGSDVVVARAGAVNLAVPFPLVDLVTDVLAGAPVQAATGTVEAASLATLLAVGLAEPVGEGAVAEPDGA